MGAILGNYVEVGCNSVLNPGTVIGSNTNVYPLSSVRGFIPRGCILRNKQISYRKTYNANIVVAFISNHLFRQIF